MVEVLPPLPWAQRHFGQAALGDERRTRRVVTLRRRAAARAPSQSIPQQCGGWKQTKGAYRLFDTPAVSFDKVQESHRRLTREAAAAARSRRAVGRATPRRSASPTPPPRGWARPPPAARACCCTPPWPWTSAAASTPRRSCWGWATSRSGHGRRPRGKPRASQSQRAGVGQVANRASRRSARRRPAAASAGCTSATARATAGRPSNRAGRGAAGSPCVPARTARSWRGTTPRRTEPPPPAAAAATRVHAVRPVATGAGAGEQAAVGAGPQGPRGAVGAAGGVGHAGHAAGPEELGGQAAPQGQAQARADPVLGGAGLRGRRRRPGPSRSSG